MSETVNTPASDTLLLRSPDSFLAALPYLLGFVPEQSVVISWLEKGKLLCTQRADLPEDCEDGAWVELMWSHGAAQQATEMIIALVGNDDVSAQLSQMLVAKAEEEGQEVRDCLWWDGQRRWKSLLCSDPHCCPEGGREISDSQVSEVAAELTWLGRSVLPSRESLHEEVKADGELAAQVRQAQLTGVAHRHGEDVEAWRDGILEQVQRLWEGETSALQSASLGVACSDIRVRDCLLWLMAGMDEEKLRKVRESLTHALRGASSEHTAPVASCLAAANWLLGDGARAQVALDRAWEADSRYSLAHLLRTSLSVGMPPSTWKDAVLGLSWEECRRRPAR